MIVIRLLEVVLIPATQTTPVRQAANYVVWDTNETPTVKTYHNPISAAFPFKGNEAAVQTFLENNAATAWAEAASVNSVIPVGILNRLDWLPLVAPLKTARMNQLSAFNGWSGLTAGEQTQVLSRLNSLRQLFYDVLKAP